ncbi:MAG TPA: hypothetical protein VHX38_23975 [Pseudonocardiaceae bacterium]|jgi:hypothetical protein|nr:hypothetical protein [Pseudonocardiaceae bacterium]
MPVAGDITTTIILPIDVAVSWLESLQTPELARWARKDRPNKI